MVSKIRFEIFLFVLFAVVLEQYHCFVFPSLFNWKRSWRTLSLPTPLLSTIRMESYNLNPFPPMGILPDKIESVTFRDLTLIKAYKDAFGNFNIPRKFVVDGIKFPSWAAGYDLGEAVENIRDLYRTGRLDDDSIKKLSRIEFAWFNRNFTSQEVKVALVAYKSLYGNLSIPDNFIVPTRDPYWPESIWAMRLGRLIKAIPQKIGFLSWGKFIDEVNEHFGKNQRTSAGISFDRIKEALDTYKRIYGHHRVPPYFNIALEDARFPEFIRGIKLGHVMGLIRRDERYVDWRRELLHAADTTLAEKVKEGIMYFKEIHGHVLIPKNYTIEEDDTRYPEDLRGMKLGENIFKTRYSPRFKELNDELLSLGLMHGRYERLKMARRETFEKVKVALMTYKSIHGNLLVKQKYEIASDDTNYPESVRGMKLGNIVHLIRNQDKYSEYRDELLALGFVFDNLRFPPKVPMSLQSPNL
jgi:hypothetical protein